MAPSHYGSERCKVTQCKQCDMIFTNPQVTTYKSEVENRGIDTTRYFRESRLARADAQARLQLKLISRFQSPGRLFDFGCGVGSMVLAAVESGWDAIGLDLNRGMVQAANERWKFDRLRTGFLEDFVNENKNPFDVIVSNQVFEHLQDPVGLGRTLVNSLLKPGGLILIDVPNAYQPQEVLSRGKTLDPTSHWCHFSRKTLSALLPRIGCELLYVNASPSFAAQFKKLGLGSASYSLAAAVKGLFPPVGSGVCVIGRKK
jgi:2-polyprenyl-3-methyl-5-hydroxy-6-metoxy-1,4-benzoquinol methylase